MDSATRIPFLSLPNEATHDQQVASIDEGVYPSLELQSVYSKAPVDSIKFQFNIF